MEHITGTAQAHYDKWVSDREPFLRRARECSLYTIPYLIPPEGHTGNSDFRTPWQGIGAWGVNSLTAKLMMALLPPNSPFFRYQIDDYTLEQLTQRPGQRAEVEKALAKRERAIKDEIEGSNIRVGLTETLRYLLVSGNALLHFPISGGVRVFRLDRYVCKRDAMGNVLHTIAKESISPVTLPESIQELIRKKNPSEQSKTEDLADVNDVDLYTHVYKTSRNWKVYQEINGVKIPGSDGTYPLGKCPWLPIRFTRIDGEDYGRGYVEEYLGDLKSLEGLSQSIIEGSAAAARILIMVNPNGTTDQKKVADAPNGAVIAGNATDVSILQMEKFSDFRMAGETIRDISERLANAFMMNSSATRNAERVTAEEIRFMAGELEATLGGTYSILSVDLQLPMVSTLEHRMERQKRLPVIPEGIIKPVIVTGMEALGRGNDLNKLTTFARVIAETLGPDAIPQEMNSGDLITRLGTSLGIDMDGLIKSPEQKAEEMQQAQMMQLAQQATGPAVQAAGRMMEKGMSNAQN